MMSHQGTAQVTVTKPNSTEPALTHAPLTEGADPAAKRILIVDDEPNIRSFVGRALAGAGYLTGFAGSGTEALRRALDSHYDLIILDLVMPDMDGGSVLDQLLRARPDQTVMVLSCVADVATKVDCLERGARDYLTKPFSLAELLARIRVRLREDVHLHGDAGKPGETAGEVIRAGNLTLDVARLVADIGQGPVPLTRLSSCCCASWRSTSASQYPRAGCWPACGDTTSTRAPTWSMCAYGACARSSALA